MAFTAVEILGIVCALLALVAFVGNQYHMLRDDDFSYDLLNFLSAAGLLVYSTSTGAFPFIITNSVWAMVSGVDVVKYIVHAFTKRNKKNPRR